jgi:hypothetical protein
MKRHLLLPLALALVAGCGKDVAKLAPELAESLIQLDKAKTANDPALKEALNLAEKSGMGDPYLEEVKGLVAAKEKMLRLEEKFWVEKNKGIEREVEEARQELKRTGQYVPGESEKKLRRALRTKAWSYLGPSSEVLQT